VVATRGLFCTRATTPRRSYDILNRLGGVRPEDAALLLDGTAHDFLAALGEMERRARDATQHGERGGAVRLLLGPRQGRLAPSRQQQLPLEALKSRLAQAPADVRIGIFDSCRSGLLTRSKGARKTPAFEIESKSARDATGLVILTSSASDEDSQESDLIGGSYFSHHLASGLAGQRRSIRRWPRHFVRGVRLRVRSHGRRHRRERRRAQASDLQL